MTDTPKPPSEDSPWHARMHNKVQQSIEVDRILSGAKTVLEVGSDAAEILVELGNGFTVPGIAALTMRGVNIMRELRARSPAEHFAEGWKPLQLHGMGETLHEAFTSHAGVQPRPVFTSTRSGGSILLACDGVAKILNPPAPEPPASDRGRGCRICSP